MNYDTGMGGKKAYGFLKYGDSGKFENELPEICKVVGMPELNYSFNDISPIEGDEELTDLAKNAEQCGMNYMITATDSGNNKSVAGEVATLFNQAYQSPLYDSGAPFEGEIVYRIGNKYAFVD